jgi:hypothetical protein
MVVTFNIYDIGMHSIGPPVGVYAKLALLQPQGFEHVLEIASRPNTSVQRQVLQLPGTIKSKYRVLFSSKLELAVYRFKIYSLYSYDSLIEMIENFDMFVFFVIHVLFPDLNTI